MPPASVTGSGVGLTQAKPMTGVNLTQAEPTTDSGVGLTHTEPMTGVDLTQAEPIRIQAHAFYRTIKKETLEMLTSLIVVIISQ